MPEKYENIINNTDTVRSEFKEWNKFRLSENGSLEEIDEHYKDGANMALNLSETHFARKTPSVVSRALSTKESRAYAEEGRLMGEITDKMKEVDPASKAIGEITEPSGLKLDYDQLLDKKAVTSYTKAKQTAITTQTETPQEDPIVESQKARIDDPEFTNGLMNDIATGIDKEAEIEQSVTENQPAIEHEL